MSRHRFAVVVAALLVLAIGVAIAWAYRGGFNVARVEVQTIAAPATPGKCHSVSGLPDPSCTPGVTDPRVTQENILTTICLSGYTAKVRPSALYTNALKRRQIVEYAYTDTNPSDYEEDHLIPLELGGHPTDPRNLWPELLTGPYSATKKDGVENSLHAKVCAGLIALVPAQAAITSNWETAQRPDQHARVGEANQAPN